MSLTLVSTPANIDNSAAFNVTTSLIEEAAHTNLRVRADVYHEGIIKAVVEKPKGLADFDFGDILKSLTPGLKFAKDSGDIVRTGTIGANLLTSWASSGGTWTTLTTAANVISSAICTVNSSLSSNTVVMVPGELYLFYSPDFARTGSGLACFLSAGGASYSAIEINKGIILMPITSANLSVIISGAGQNFSGTFYLYKITTNRTTIGNPLAPYFAIFTEVYEDAAGVTQVGTPSPSVLKRFVPAIGDGTAFSEFVLHDATSLFANKTLKNNVTKFYTITPSEYSVCFFTEYVDLKLIYSKDGAATASSAFSCYEGWGAIIINIGELMAGVTGYLAFMIANVAETAMYSAALQINIDTLSIDERTVLEFDGLVGGKEYLAFEGIKDIEFTTIRNYYTGSKKNRKPISFTGINRQKLETRFKDMANADYLKSLLISDNVKRLEPSYGVPSDVTILTDSVTIDKGREFFTNRLDIEYEY